MWQFIESSFSFGITKKSNRLSFVSMSISPFKDEDIPFRVGIVVCDISAFLRWRSDWYDYEYRRESSGRYEDYFDLMGLISFYDAPKKGNSIFILFYAFLNRDSLLISIPKA